MIKAQDLRIGNHIIANGEQAIVSAIEESPFPAIQYRGLKCVLAENKTWILLDNCDGIPLTEEWLLKFGFERQEEDLTVSFVRQPFHLTGNKLYFSHSYDDYVTILCEAPMFVHQLQNLYFALTQKELEFK